MDYVSELYSLTNKFYNDYPESTYPELMTPHGNRTYNCFIINYLEHFICIPFRTEMNHKNGYRFRTSRRSRQHKSGLDYSKIIIVKNYSDYLTPQNALVDNDEYNEVVQNAETIINEAKQYIDVYVKYQNDPSTLNPIEFRKKYQYTTLKYFHDLLPIS